MNTSSSKLNTSKLNTSKLNPSKSFIRKQSRKAAYSIDAEDDPNAFLKESKYNLSNITKRN